MYIVGSYPNLQNLPRPSTKSWKKSAPRIWIRRHGACRGEGTRRETHHTARFSFAATIWTVYNWHRRMCRTGGACITTVTKWQRSETNRYLALVVMRCRDTLWHNSWKMPRGCMGSIAFTSLLGRNALCIKRGLLGSAMDLGPHRIDK